MGAKVSERSVVPGDKLHIITRRLFPEDVRRHFAGEVISASEGLYEIQGYTFVFHSSANEYRKRPELRTRIYSLGDAGHIVNKLPREVDIGSLEYRVIEQRLVVTDSKGFLLDINEFGLLS
jgi:hypothetical protein